GEAAPPTEASGSETTKPVATAQSVPEEAARAKTTVRSEPPEVKIVKTPVTARIVEPGGEKADIKAQAAAKTRGSNEPTAPGFEFRAGYVIAATLISVLVAFVWYRFFLFVSDWKSGRNS
ncbi:MAG TPA: hypothetical protein PLK58_16430, partial [Candidatus Rifleibacterium sp.]|nr:hypothetical protein [Candidatus Rifleibacterium sp.]